jgi:hypothetical protein
VCVYIYKLSKAEQVLKEQLSALEGALCVCVCVCIYKLSKAEQVLKERLSALEDALGESLAENAALKLQLSEVRPHTLAA